MARSRVGPLEVLLAAMTAGLMAFVGNEAWRTHERDVAKERAAAEARLRQHEAEQLSAMRDVSHTTRRSDGSRRNVERVADLDGVRARIVSGAAGTYIGDLLKSQDSVLYRWSDRTVETLRVWVQPRSTAADWSPEFVSRARDAFPEWGAAGFPVRFTFVLDSLSADVRVMWLQRFPSGDGQRVGRADRQSDAEGWIRHADLFVAVHDSADRPIPPEWVAAIARHEVGHALGLGHTTDSTAIMYPTSRAPSIGDADRATLRFLYTLPPGSLKGRLPRH